MANNYKVLWEKAAAEDLKSIIEHICVDSPPAAGDSLKK